MMTKSIFALMVMIALPQSLFRVMTTTSLTPGPTTPTFVNETSLNSSQSTWNGTSTALGTATNSVCFSFSYCIPAPDATLSNNLLVMPYTYKNSTAVTTTGHDNKTNTWTCVNGSQDSGTNIWDGLCYAPGTTAGVTQAYVTFGTTAVTNVSGKLSQWYDVATSSPVDANNSAAGTSSTTVNAVSVTTTQTNDLIYVHVCPVGTAQTAVPTPGSGYTLLTEGPLSTVAETCWTEYKIDAGTGTVTPTMTLNNASTYVEQVFAFKGSPSVAGTPPSGTYVERAMQWSSPLGSSTTSWPFQFTSSGNLLIERDACGGTGPMVPSTSTVPSDSNNTWSSVGQYDVGGLVAGEYDAVGASADTSGSITITTAGTGDCTFLFDSVVNAAPTGGVMYGWLDSSVSFSTAAFTFTSIYLPQATNYLSALESSVTGATGLSIGTSGSVWDGGFFGNEPNPEPVSENNIWGHFYGSTLGSNQSVSVTMNQAVSNGETGDLGTYLTSTGIGIRNFTSHQNGDAGCTFNSSTDLHCTIPAPIAGNAIVVAVGAFNSTARTISKVCLGDTADHTCATGTQLGNTDFSGATTTGTASQGVSAVWDTLSAPLGGPTSIDIVTSASVTNLEFAYWEVAKGSGAAWSADTTGAKVQNGTVSSSTATGGSVTTTGTQDFCAAIVTVSAGITANPKSGNEFIYAGAGTAPLFSTTGDAATSLLTTVAAAHTPSWTDGSGTFNSSTGCIK